MIREKGIFLLHAGLPKTIIESQVIAHVRAMRKAGVDIEVWSYAVTKESFSSAQEMLKRLGYYNIPIKVFRGFRPAFPLSELLNALLLNYHLNKENFRPTFIHCRTEYSASVAGFLKRRKYFRLIWDCRGNSESEFLPTRRQWRSVKRMFSFLKLYSIRLRLFWASKQADEAIFVSDSLKRLYAKGAHNYRSKVIPSVASTEYFYFNSTVRANTRKKLPFDSSDKVFIYSGSLTSWQCFSETIDLIKKFIKQDSDFKAIILTPNVSKAKQFLQDCPSKEFVCLSVTLTEVNAYLNAADFAFLLRRPGPINRVASPTKFAEYCLVGLPVIMTNAVEQAYRLGTQFGNAITYEFGQELELPEPFTDTERYQIAERTKRILSREAVLGEYLQIYRRGDQ